MFLERGQALLWGVFAVALWRGSVEARPSGELRAVDPVRKFMMKDASSADERTACPIIVPRRVWGARPPKSRQDMATPVPFVVLHHTYMDECFNLDDCCKMMREIQDLHMDDRGWDDIAYSFLVGEDGRVYEGRGWDTVGSHAPWYNFRSIGISIMGNYTAKLPNKQAISAFQSIVSCAIENNKLNANYTLYGHRQATPLRTCPGEALFEAMWSWPHWQAGDHFPPKKTGNELEDVHAPEMNKQSEENEIPVKMRTF
ncbi:peptidoglycan recognition protein 1-like [Diadema setosum]|uniref:peptidoglycan recognition protein 1-like n=1 Tax=Diadema setosum TaxID=31175 RepID=UPI003B3BC63B